MERCFVYVIRSQVDGTLYIGISSRLRRRIAEHNSGACRSTRGKRPWVLVHREEYPDHRTARERERLLKCGAGRDWLRGFIEGEDRRTRTR